MDMPHRIDNPEEGGSTSEGAEASGSSTTVREFLQANIGTDVQSLFAVEPRSWCPHLVEVGAVPSAGLDVKVPCEACEDTQENWVCLSCYKVLCGRYRNKHMLEHFQDSKHHLTLSFSDLSVWCYGCETYMHNPTLTPAKEAAHSSKFGEIS